MEEEHRGIALVILGIIAVIAVIGLVLMFSGAKKSTGAVFTNIPIDTTTGIACDSPCTIFPSGNEYDQAMMEARLNSGNRKWVYIGQVKLDGTTRTGYISASTNSRYDNPILGCWCPVQGNPAFAPTQEHAAIIPGTGSGAASGAGRYPGTPVDAYRTINYPAGIADTMQQPPSYPYPASMNK